jgi:hypothetical protein
MSAPAPPPPGFAADAAIEIDARGWLPPEPFHRTVDTLERLTPSQWIRLLLYRTPYPLFEALDEWGWRYAVHEHDDGTVEIQIWKPAP